MTAPFAHVAEACLRAAEDNTMTFPEIVGRLAEAGVESYAVDLRRGSATYYGGDGESVVIDAHHDHAPVAEGFDAVTVQVAIKEAQQLVAGYSYAGFRRKVMAAGCAGYFVSFPGKRAVYFGRTGEIHTEHFPQ